MSSRVRIPLVAVLAVAALLVLRWVMVARSTTVYQTFPSPGGNYAVVVYRRSPFLPTLGMPGQGSDGPGVVRLLDKRGNVLAQAGVPSMISNVDTVTWAKRSVVVKLLAEWPLPAPDTH